MPLVSVLITVFNRENYLAAAVESVLGQTLDDFELIIVDDCSKDRSAPIARRYLPDPRVRLEVNVRNLGDYPNRNRAASLARGKYLKSVEADDLIYPHCLETMVEAMERFPEAGFGISSSVPGVISPSVLSPHDAYSYEYGGGGLLDAGASSTNIRRCRMSLSAAARRRGSPTPRLVPWLSPVACFWSREPGFFGGRLSGQSISSFGKGGISLKRSSYCLA